MEGWVGFCDLGGLIQIVRLKKEEGGDGPLIACGRSGALLAALCAFWRKNTRVKLVAGGVRTLRPLDHLLCAPLPFLARRRSRALAKDNYESPHICSLIRSLLGRGMGLRVDTGGAKDERGHSRCQAEVLLPVWVG
jgi:hypothetical protein